MVVNRHNRASVLFSILLITYSFILFFLVNSTITKNTETRSFAKAKDKECKKGTLYCGVTDSCMSYRSCVEAGKPKADAAKAKTQALSKLVQIVPAAPVKNNVCPSGMYRCSCGCFEQSQFNSIQTVNCSDMCDAAAKKIISTSPKIQLPEKINPISTSTVPSTEVTGSSPISLPKSPTSIAPISTNITACPSNTFKCTCGCFSAGQFRGAGTDKCSVMCDGGVRAVVSKKDIPAVFTTQGTSVSIPTSGVVNSQISSQNSSNKTGSYYSQVDPAWASQSIPGQERYTFIQAGCGEVTVANILSNAGKPINPNQASVLVNPYKDSSGTSYQQNISALEKQGFSATLYPASFKTLPAVMGPNDVVWLTVKATDTTYKNMGHHTYIDGYTIENGTPVYSLRDPYFGSDMKCTPDGDRSLSCSSPERNVRLDVPVTNSPDGGTAAIILTPEAITM